MVLEERRKRPELRRVIDTAALGQRKALIFLSRGTEPDRLDALEKQIRETPITPLMSVKKDLDKVRKGTWARLNHVIPGQIFYGNSYVKVECLEDLANVSRSGMLKQKNIAVKTVDALAKVMARKGIYFKGEGPG
ncbi:MAG: hypothetical protein V1861_01775 [Candidatus Micrarchaeota archaeon]